MIEITSKDIFRFESKIYKTEYCWLWEGSRNGKKNYGFFGYREKLILAHRFAFMLYKNIDPGDFLVCHTCDIPPCVNPDHLFLGTDKINVEDCANKGRLYLTLNQFGENNVNCKLTKQKVLKIRYMYKLGYTYQELAKVFSVSYHTIGQIIRHETWKDI